MISDRPEIVQQGFPDVEAVVELLNEAYDGWGNERYLRWKYDHHPDYDPEEHVFSIEIDGELVAFVRITYKELASNGQTVPVYVIGDAAVATDYQGQGLYSHLHSRAMEYIYQDRATKAVSYNQKNNQTFEANLNRGREFRELPLKIRILSPAKVLKHYAHLVTDELPVPDQFTNIVGDRIYFRTATGVVHLNELLDTTPYYNLDTDRSLGISLSDRAVIQLVETVTNRNTRKLFVKPFALLGSGEISLRNGQYEQATSSCGEVRTDINIVHRESVSETELDEILGLYSSDEPSFRRTSEDIRHLLSFPESDVLLAKRDGDITGYAVVGRYENGGLLKGSVLEHRVASDQEYSVLLGEVEQVARKREYDLISILSERSPGGLWASLQCEVMMWEPSSGLNDYRLLFENANISLYDVV